MLFELTLIPVGNGSHTSKELAEVLEIIDSSQVAYQLTPTATCLEGTWEEIMPVIRKCHEHIRRRCTHVVTFLKIEGDETVRNKLHENVRSVEEKADRPLATTAAPATASANN